MKGHRFYSFCNCSFIKFSYSAMPNVGAIIATIDTGKMKSFQSNNRTNLLKTPHSGDLENTNPKVHHCNCCTHQLCPLKGFCLHSNEVYKATDKETSMPGCFYIGSMVQFKSRFRAYISSFSNRKYSNSTTLASYIHLLKGVTRKYSIEWFVLTRSPNFQMDTSTCRLCIKKSLMILHFSILAFISKAWSRYLYSQVLFLSPNLA